jgi:hypothetical protein
LLFVRHGLVLIVVHHRQLVPVVDEDINASVTEPGVPSTQRHSRSVGLLLGEGGRPDQISGHGSIRRARPAPTCRAPGRWPAGVKTGRRRQ